MGYQAQGFQRFRETLKYEDIIHNQIEALRQIFNRGDPTEIRYGVMTLLDLITPNIEDELFIEQLQNLDSEWEKEKKKKDKQYKKDLKSASGGCPDLIEKPSVKPGVEHFKKMFMVANALLERKNLGLKIEKTAYD